MEKAVEKDPKDMTYEELVPLSQQAEAEIGARAYRLLVPLAELWDAVCKNLYFNRLAHVAKQKKGLTDVSKKEEPTA